MTTLKELEDKINQEGKYKYTNDLEKNYYFSFPNGATHILPTKP